MTEWLICTDSCCELRTLEDATPGVAFAVVPFKIRVGEREFTDTSMLHIPEMMSAMDNYNGASTSSCPNPEEFAQAFIQGEKVLCFTISQNLSGSYNAAMAARDMVLEEHPDRQIAVIDLLSCGASLTSAIWAANRHIAEGMAFEEVVAAVVQLGKELELLFALASFENLVKNGRVNRVVGFIAGKLGMRILGRASENGTIDFFFKGRGGETRILARILEDMKEKGFHCQHPVIISHVNNEKGAHMLQHGIHELWPQAEVHILPCSGLTSFYAQDQGMLVSY